MEGKLYENITVGLVITGSFCTFKKIINVIQSMKDRGMDIVPVFSERVQNTDNRFNKAEEFIKEVEAITGNKGMYCITDSTALMAAKAHLRNEKPLVIALSTNDALGMNLKNIGMLMNVKNIYFVPFGQDNYNKKPSSMVAHMDRTVDTIIAALNGKQVQPVVVSPY